MLRTWPISLCNESYKINSKVIANSFGVLDKVIRPYQSVFVKKTMISDNYILAHEIYTLLRGKRKIKPWPLK